MRRAIAAAAGVFALAASGFAAADGGAKLFSIETQKSEVAAGAAGRVGILIKTKRGAHVSAEAPLKINLTAKGLKLSKEKLVGGDAVEGKGASPRFEVPFVAEAKGPATVDADLTFFICTEKLCERQASKVTIPVTVL